MSDEKKSYTNSLIHESSPYLLQHAHNPVNWYAWNDDSLLKAKQEHKPILVSIGYSACHWCHVMERESFENEEIAALMNAHFICIKVDREERPDVDQVYMNALQMITGQGGWPLNMFALPDGSPFHGGTYFRPEEFKRLLEIVHHEFSHNEDKLRTFSEELKKGMQSQLKVMQMPASGEFKIETLEKGVADWSEDFDATWGGTTRVPKFPMPVCWKFLLAYDAVINPGKMRQPIHQTLERMGRGGIFDQIGGGFARYSTDRLWKVPHFEKMLYDNGQLLELYADGYKSTLNPEYKRLIDSTIQWLESEMLVEDKLWMSALDADSEGEEGKFYVWQEQELERVLGKEYPWVKQYYNINKLGYWEHNHYILMRDASDEVIADEMGLTLEELHQKVDAINQSLRLHRNTRVRPGVDDKCLTSWNALTVLGVLEVYRATGENSVLNRALSTLNVLHREQIQPNGKVNRSYKHGISSISGFLDDYALLALAMERMYECTLEEEWLKKSERLTETILERFYEPEEKMFYYTGSDVGGLVVRPVETYDNVMPSATSVVCELLLRLGHRLDKRQWVNISRHFVLTMAPLIERATESFANWARLYLTFSVGLTEVSITGPNALPMLAEIQRHYLPLVLYSGSLQDSDLPLLSGKHQAGKTLIYICKNMNCLSPVETTSEALALLKGA